MIRICFALVIFVGSSVSAHAQSLDEIARRETALVEAWEKTPLTVRKVLFVSERPVAFGQYVERPSNVFRPDEKLIAYAEPVGYGWRDLGDGMFEFGFAVDFLIKSPTGKILAGEEDFSRLAERSHARNREFMLTLTLNLTGAPPGDYILEYKLRDITGAKTAVINLPFKIAE